MSRKEDDLAVILGALAVGAGLGFLAGTYKNNEEKQSHFLRRLAGGLAEYGIRFISATFGRTVKGMPVWMVLVDRNRGGIEEFRVQLAEASDPYSNESCDEAIRGIADSR